MKKFYIAFFIHLFAFLLNGCTSLEIAQQEIAPKIPVESPKIETPAAEVAVKKLTLDEKFLIEAKKLATTPADIKAYCGKDIKDKELFYQAVLKNMAVHESGLKNSSTYYECSKKACQYSGGCFTDPVRGYCMKSGEKWENGFVVSRGLFQMSISSSRSLGCTWLEKPEDLHDEDKNIKCASLALTKYFTQDKVIAARKDGKWLGAARYWAVMRETKGGEPRASYADIKAKACAK